MTLHDKYEAAPLRAYQGLINDLSDGTNTSINVALLDAGHSPNLTGHVSWADVSADDITNTASNATNYSLGGQTLTNQTWSSDLRVSTFDADSVTWSNSTIDAGYAVVYDNTPSTDSDKSLLTLVDFEGEQNSEDGDFTIDWDSNGIFEIDTNP